MWIIAYNTEGFFFFLLLFGLDVVGLCPYHAIHEIESEWLGHVPSYVEIDASAPMFLCLFGGWYLESIQN